MCNPKLQYRHIAVCLFDAALINFFSALRLSFACSGERISCKTWGLPHHPLSGILQSFVFSFKMHEKRRLVLNRLRIPVCSYGRNQKARPSSP
jgi:hypothetical protein